MSKIEDLESLLGKNINKICDNGFHNPGANHCAHFVAHARNLTFSYNCRDYVGGSKQAANIRVHEIFSQCPKVGLWKDADLSREQLVFVTRKDIVNISTKTMQNIPQKHVGIFSNGYIYNYSNTADKVIKQPPDEFLDRFQKAYSGDQGLFFGYFPSDGLLLEVDATAASVPSFGFKLRRDSARWYAKRLDVAGAEFLVGAEVNQPAKKYYGVHLSGKIAYGPQFDPKVYEPVIDHWAYLLDVTAAGEGGGYMNVINTYDRAQFTFGFYQLAAHTPRDNLILLFREALENEIFRSLFPDLKLKAGRVFKIGTAGETDLEAETYEPANKEYQLKAFMTYLNPNRTIIDEQEVLQAARLVWWTSETGDGRETQVKVANSILQSKMSTRYASWYKLDGELDTVCAVIADIHHQGRGTKTAVREALKKSDKLAELTKIGEEKYPERCKAIRACLKKWVSAGAMGKKKYNSALNEFV